MHSTFREFQLNEYERNHFIQMFSEEGAGSMNGAETPHCFIHNGSIMMLTVHSAKF